MARLVIPIGIPGSGKSTYAKKLEERNPSVCVVNPDSIRGGIYGYGKPGIKFNPDKEAEVWGEARKSVDECIAGKRSVFIDATNPDRFGRANIISWFKGSGYDIEAVRFVIEPGLAILRNKNRKKQDVLDKVICKKHISMREPAPAEGFARVKYIGMPPTAAEMADLSGKDRDDYDCMKILKLSNP